MVYFCIRNIVYACRCQFQTKFSIRCSNFEIFLPFDLMNLSLGQSTEKHYKNGTNHMYEIYPIPAKMKKEIPIYRFWKLILSEAEKFFSKLKVFYLAPSTQETLDHKQQHHNTLSLEITSWNLFDNVSFFLSFFLSFFISFFISFFLSLHHALSLSFVSFSCFFFSFFLFIFFFQLLSYY